VTIERVRAIERLLTTEFAPVELQVKDQSHLHAGHAGAQEGKGHFEVRIVSECFDGHARLARHRMVYDALRPLMDSDIHALQINAISPAEI